MAGKTKAEVVGFDDKATEIHNLYESFVEPVNSSSAAEVHASIAARILAAETIDDILGVADAGTIGAKDIVGRPFTILDRPTWMKAGAQYQEGSGYFVVLNLGMLDDSEALTVTTGAENVLAALAAMQTKGMLPNDVPMTFKKVQSSQGFDVLWLAKADQASR